MIEKLGGYKEAKRYYNLDPYHHTEEMKEALLQYRREHNIFEKDDHIVFDVTKPFCEKMQPDLMKVINPKYQENDMIVLIDNQIYVVGGEVVRHATELEIQAGRRL